MKMAVNHIDLGHLQHLHHKPLQPDHLDGELVSDSRHLLISSAALAECDGDGGSTIS